MALLQLPIGASEGVPRLMIGSISPLKRMREIT
jgi:hypothetical protein